MKIEFVGGGAATEARRERFALSMVKWRLARDNKVREVGWFMCFITSLSQLELFLLSLRRRLKLCTKSLCIIVGNSRFQWKVRVFSRCGPSENLIHNWVSWWSESHDLTHQLFIHIRAINSHLYLPSHLHLLSNILPPSRRIHANFFFLPGNSLSESFFNVIRESFLHFEGRRERSKSEKRL